jgi:hypothetical protein
MHCNLLKLTQSKAGFDLHAVTTRSLIINLYLGFHETKFINSEHALSRRVRK